MGIPTDIDLLRQELETLAGRKAAAIKELDIIAAEEQRLESALSVVQSLRAKHCFNPDNAAVYQAAPLGPNTQFGTPAVILSPPKAPDNVSADDKAPTVELLLREAVANVGAQGATSSALFEAVLARRGATVNTLTSTLSRLVGKKQIRREGKLYFHAATH